MVLNPELQLRPLSIRRETNTIEDHRSTGKPVRMESPLSARVGAPISGPPANPVVRAPQVSPHTTEPTRPKAKESPTEDARPKKKQRANRHNHFLDYSHHSPNLGDIPPEGFNSDNSDDDTCRRHFPSNPRPISPPPGNPSALVNDPPRPPTVEDHSIPAVAKSGTTATPAVTPVVPPRSSVHSNIRPWTGAEDHELFTFKNDTGSRPDNRPPVET